MSTTGTVKWFDPREGHGAIQPDGGGREVIVESAVVPPGVTLKQGLRIEFEFQASPKGLMATQVLLPRG
jgi:CspA family cold shock protein